MMNQSELTGEWYQDEDMCFFRNHVQAAYYKSWGAKLYDLFVDSNHKWVFVFSKKDHMKYRDLWRDRKEIME